MMKDWAPLSYSAPRFTNLIGTGGIGTGMFFLLEGEHTLGRDESRSGKLVPYKDYCKLHIITHYIAILMGANNNEQFQLYPLGKLGEDDAGHRLYKEMKQTGMSMNFVDFDSTLSTLFSVCFQYPDSSGGNITTSNSASERITAQDVETACHHMPGGIGPQTVVLAVPEVPLASRISLLHYGRENGAYNVSSVLASEVKQFEQSSGFQLTDYLSVNRDEAIAIAETSVGAFELIVDKCIEKLNHLHPGIALSITDGSRGSYGYSDGKLEFVPSLPVKAEGTGGAGDAFLAGTIVGLALGLPFRKGANDQRFGATPLSSALELGTLVASLSVTSPDTIHGELDAELLIRHAQSANVSLSEPFSMIFPKN